MNSIPWNQRLIPTSDVLHQSLDGEMVLLHLGSEQYFGLDRVGSRIWELLGQLGRLDAVEAQLLSEYDTDQQTLHGDIERLIAELLEADLLRVA
jgi:Coenzyme PQQ synthesis protein D (PqqD)